MLGTRWLIVIRTWFTKMRIISINLIENQRKETKLWFRYQFNYRVSQLSFKSNLNSFTLKEPHQCMDKECIGIKNQHPEIWWKWRVLILKPNPKKAPKGLPRIFFQWPIWKEQLSNFGSWMLLKFLKTWTWALNLTFRRTQVKMLRTNQLMDCISITHQGLKPLFNKTQNFCSNPTTRKTHSLKNIWIICKSESTGKTLSCQWGKKIFKGSI